MQSSAKAPVHMCIYAAGKKGAGAEGEDVHAAQRVWMLLAKQPFPDLKTAP
jgi:hypothetical protein